MGTLVFDSFLVLLGAKTHKLAQEAEEVEALEGEKGRRAECDRTMIRNRS